MLIQGVIPEIMAHTISKLVTGDLDAASIIVGSHNWIVSASELEIFYLPMAGTIVDAINQKIMA